MKRIFTATLGTETNTFAPLPTSLQSFKDLVYVPADEMAAKVDRFRTGPLFALLERKSKAGDVEIALGPAFFAQPGGTTTRATYENLRDQLLEALKLAGPVSGVALGLHGAMVADGYPDCEGDLISRVRSIVGPSVPIAIELDPHCHISEEMRAGADIVILYKEYPHTDVNERAVELVDILCDTIDKTLIPSTSYAVTNFVAAFHTTEDPYKGFIDRVREIEASDDRVLSISIAHGFPWGDTADMGSGVLVVTNEAKSHGDEIALSLAEELKDLRFAAAEKSVSVPDMVAIASRAENRPVIVADAADNPGGGAPSDSTYVLRALLDAGVTNVAAGLIWDPHAVRIASDAGEGASLSLRVGGKTCALSGDPLDLLVRVDRVIGDGYENFAGMKWRLGQAVAVSAGETELVLTTQRIQCFSPFSFEQFGIDPAAKQVLIVKSSQHFRAAFADIAGDVVYVRAPGVVTEDLSTLPYREINRPKWPIDEVPAESKLC